MKRFGVEMSETGVQEYPGDVSLPKERWICRCGVYISKPGGLCSSCINANVEKFNKPHMKPVEFKVTQRKYLPTLSDLVDRLAIVQLKAINIPEHSAEYVQERSLIEHDIGLILDDLAKDGKHISASEVHAILVIMLSNHFIWINESKARQGGPEQDKLLKLTHSINGVRNTAKNQLANVAGGRKDYKTDCFAAELVADFGNWNIW
jgi:hypothetical protein